MHSFVSSLSAYIFDAAIGSNFDCFLVRLSKERFSDVFELSEEHSKMMDDILSACLLRSSQRASADLLMGCLEVVLDLGILTSKLYRGDLEEYRAIPILNDLNHKFRRLMRNLVRSAFAPVCF
jgi:hypothetical protein